MAPSHKNHTRSGQMRNAKLLWFNQLVMNGFQVDFKKIKFIKNLQQYEAFKNIIDLMMLGKQLLLYYISNISILELFKHLLDIFDSLNQEALFQVLKSHLETRILKPILDKGLRSKVQWNWTFLLIRIFKLVPKPLDKGVGPKKIKLWFNLFSIILEGNQLVRTKKKNASKKKLMIWRTKV
jgi:hypothetical protein